MGKLLKFISHRYISTHCVLHSELRTIGWKQETVLKETHPLVKVIDVCYGLNVCDHPPTPQKFHMLKSESPI